MKTDEIESVKKKYARLPSAKRRRKIGQTIFGLVLVAIGAAVALRTDGTVVQSGGIGLIGLGGFFVSQDMTRQGLELLVATAKDLVATTRSLANGKSEKATDTDTDESE